MAGSTGEEYGLESQSSSVEGISSGQGCQTGDSLVEWRSSEQVENGTPSTSPPYWDTDDDDDFGPKPSDLYGKFTWKIENFSQITKRELRSNVFEVGGYKWYILIYPQGCDVCNHLSLFLCVANHDKLLPGWSHFAQFTIAVVNKDSKKSKYSDTLHRFWKKEHDWGWKKFMELSKLSDGFIVADALVIKAQVQVIREKTHRPFRCLDCQYRRELVRVYLSNVEQLCRRYVEEKRGKFSKMIEDKVRWSSFRSFWLGVDQNARRWMSRDKTEAILKVVVKHFFIEKEVTSTLVMDSLYSGLKSIECQSKNNKGTSKLLEIEEMSVPFVHVEKDMFVLTDDVLLLLERAALEPILPKDEKGSQNQNQNRTKDSSSGEEFTKDSIERDERRLTELGRRTVEIFVLNHIFSRIEVAYQEAVALERQEELIREEEAAGLAENELKLKRSAMEKEKRAKKKQAKQKRNSRKGKERVRDDKTDAIVQEKDQEGNISSERILDELSETQALSVPENAGDVSDVSDSVDDVAETLQPDLDERDASPVSWDADTSETHPAMETTSSEMQSEQAEKKSSSVMDDSSSTCSTDSIPSVVMNGPYKRNTISSNKASSSPSRGKTQQNRNLRDRTGQGYGDTNKLQSDCMTDASRLRDVAVCCKTTAAESKASVLPSRDCTQRLEQHVTEKQEELVTLQKRATSKDQVDEDRPSKPRTTEQSSPASPIRNPSTLQQAKQTSENITASEAIPIRVPSSNSESQTEKLVSLLSRSPSSSKQDAKSVAPMKITTVHQGSAMSRPPSAPLIPAPRVTAPLVSTAQAVPLLSRSVSAAGRLGADTSPSTQSNVLQSYRNAIMCKTTMSASSPNFAPRPSSSAASPTPAYAQSLPSFAPSPLAIPLQKSARMDHTLVRPGLTFGSVNPESLQTRRQWADEPLQFESTSSIMHNSNLVGDIRRLDISGTRPCSFYFDEAASMRQTLGVAHDEFPHLDIINDLLDEEQSVSRLGSSEYHHPRHPTLNRQYTFPGDISTAADVGTSNGSCYFDRMGQYYDDGIPRLYGSASGRFDLTSDQLDLSAYVNGQLEGINRNQWPPMGSVDHSILGLGSAETNGYPYQLPDSSNLACGLNGYSMYRPANGL